MKTNNGYSRLALLGHLCAIGVAGYFIYAAYGKIRDPRQFAVDIGNFQMTPVALQNLMAIFMPWWEVGAAVALALPRTRRAGAIMVSALLLVFIVAVAYAAFYLGLDITCGCTGKDSSPAGWLTILRNVGLLAATVFSVTSLPARRRAASAGGRMPAATHRPRPVDLPAETCAER